MAQVYDEQGNAVGEDYAPVYADPSEPPASPPVYPDEGPSFIQSLIDREKAYWEQAQTGVRQMPGYNYLTDLLSGAKTESKGGLLDALKAPLNLGMGVLGMIDPVGTVGSEVGKRGWQAAGEPGGEWGQLGAELLGGIGGGMGGAKILSKLPGITPAVRRGLQTVEETQQVLGSKISPIEAAAAKTVSDPGATQLGMFGREAPEMGQAMGSRIDPYGPTAERIIRDSGADQLGMFRSQSPNLPVEIETTIAESLSPADRMRRAELKAFLSKKGLSADEREWAASQLRSIDNKTTFKTHDVTRFNESPGSILTSGEAGQPGLLESRVPASPGGIVRGATEPVSDFLTGGTKTISDDVLGQPGLLQGEVPAFKGGIVREGTGVVGEVPTGRKVASPGQLDQVGYQQELFDEMKGKRVKPAPSETHPPDPTLTDKISNWYMMNMQNPLVKSTGLLVTAPGTALRNFMYQGYRSTLEVPMQALQEMIYTGSFEGAWQRAATQLTGVFDSAAYRKELFDVMERAPKEVREMLGRRGMIADYAELPAADWYDKTIQPVQKWLNKANELQEKGFWYTNLAASINGQLAPMGVKLGRDLRAGQLPQQVINKAIDHAFEMTYSSPMGDKVHTAYKAVLNMPIAGILLNEAAPFARFNYSNALKEVIEMSPAGMALAGLKAFDPRTAEEAARGIAKSMIGTKMIEQFARIKQDPTLDVWEVPLPGYGKVDMRRWFPLSAYALLGELFNRPLGTKNARVSGEDLESVLTGGTRIDDTAIGVLARMKDLSLQGAMRGLGESATTMMARWTTPFKGLNDAYALVTGDPNVMAARDVTTRRFGPFDKAAANIPGLRQMLPERIDPSLGPGERPGPRNRDEYVAQLAGLDTVRSNVVKDELSRLKFTGSQGDALMESVYARLREKGIDVKSPVELEGSTTAGDFPRKMYASEGDKDLNRAMNTLMRDVGQPFLERFMTSEGYKNAPLELQRFIINQWQTELKSTFKKVAVAGGGPEVAMEQFFKDMSPITRGFLEYMTIKEK